MWDDEGLEPLERDSHVEALLDRADEDRKARQLRGEPNPYVAAWQRDEQAAAAIFGRCETMSHSSRCIRALGHPGGCYLIAGQGL